jgi:serine/threonine protein kinase
MGDVSYLTNRLPLALFPYFSFLDKLKSAILDIGGFGNIQLAVDTKYNTQVIIKSSNEEEDSYKLALKEAHLLRHINNNDRNDTHHIPKLLNAFNDKNHVYMVLPVFAMDLLKFTNSKYQITSKDFESIVRQILEGVNFLHGLNILHGDIKLSNIMIEEKPPMAPKTGFSVR